jgi:ribosomal protein S18 acetylase RimI-like enzyme
MRFFGRAREDGEVCEQPGVAVIYCGLDYAAFNTAVMSHPVSPGGGELESRVNGPATYFKSRKLRWSYWYCDDLVGPGSIRRTRDLLQQQNMVELTEAPGMIADDLSPASRPLPRVEVRRVSDQATRSAFAHITSITFDVPWSICRDVYGNERAWQQSFHGYVGYVNGMAIATTSIVVAAGVAGVYSVGTIPGHRSRGYAEAVMREALAQERRTAGFQKTVLQSTRSGYALYTRMGYRRVANFTVFITE